MQDLCFLKYAIIGLAALLKVMAVAAVPALMAMLNQWGRKLAGVSLQRVFTYGTTALVKIVCHLTFIIIFSIVYKTTQRAYETARFISENELCLAVLTLLSIAVLDGLVIWAYSKYIFPFFISRCYVNRVSKYMVEVKSDYESRMALRDILIEEEKGNDELIINDTKLKIWGRVFKEFCKVTSSNKNRLSPKREFFSSCRRDLYRYARFLSAFNIDPKLHINKLKHKRKKSSEDLCFIAAVVSRLLLFSKHDDNDERNIQADEIAENFDIVKSGQADDYKLLVVLYMKQLSGIIPEEFMIYDFEKTEAFNTSERWIYEGIFDTMYVDIRAQAERVYDEYHDIFPKFNPDGMSNFIDQQTTVFLEYVKSVRE